MKKLCGALLACAVFYAHANVPSDKDILAWLANPEDSQALTQKAIDIVRTEKVRLLSGEEAYLSAVAFEDAGRNFWAGYIFTRPVQKESRILKGLGGQSHTFRVHPYRHKDKEIDLVELESAGSGQGTMNSEKTLFALNDWQMKAIATVESADYPGPLDEKSGEEDCKKGVVREGFLNLMPPYVLAVSAVGNACEGKQPQDFTIEHKLIDIKLP